MSRRFRYLLILFAAGLLLFAVARSMLAASPASTSMPHDNGAHATGPQVVWLNQLEQMYEAVPFDHKRHADMADMWHGCTTCHHHTPEIQAAREGAPATRTQAEAGKFPACKTCHQPSGDAADINMPTLKGAYHRQCLNCHRDWMGENACVICHAPKRGKTPATTQATLSPDDITGRMHKPIPMPGERQYKARYTPVAGDNVLFRHDEHVTRYGISCAVCHHKDTCASCHSAETSPASRQATTTAATFAATTITSATRSQFNGSAKSLRPHPVQPGKTWRESHAPCISCHQEDACGHCHYKDGEAPTPPFTHGATGQLLDADHEKITCGKCHTQIQNRATVGCGDASCHKNAVSFPTDRPGPFRPRPATATSPATTRAATAPSTTAATTRPIMIKIRRGGL